MESFLPYITGSGGALAVMAYGLYLFLAGKLHSHAEFGMLETENDRLRAENNAYRDALGTERKTVNEAVSANQVTNQLINALTAIAGARSPGGPGLAEGDPVR